jgi:hypothetical protein
LCTEQVSVSFTALGRSISGTRGLLGISTMARRAHRLPSCALRGRVASVLSCFQAVLWDGTAASADREGTMRIGCPLDLLESGLSAANGTVAWRCHGLGNAAA